MTQTITPVSKKVIMYFYLTFIFVFLPSVYGKMELRPDEDLEYNRLSDHSVVTDSNVFPYVVAVLKKDSYMSAGALLSDVWVLTAADALFLVRESARIIRVRLGSINYKKGGVLLPVKSIEVHPHFDDRKPVFDVALMLLPEKVYLTPSLYPIRMLNGQKEVTATHFIVTAWTPSSQLEKNPMHPVPMEFIKRRRMLTVSHLHPAVPDFCSEELSALEVNYTRSLLCLEPELRADPCWRDTGAPVVLNGVLWGIISSWRPDDCSSQPSSVFVSLVASSEIRSWLLATTTGYRRHDTENEADNDQDDDLDDDLDDELDDGLVFNKENVSNDV